MSRELKDTAYTFPLLLPFFCQNANASLETRVFMSGQRLLSRDPENLAGWQTRDPLYYFF